MDDFLDGFLDLLSQSGPVGQCCCGMGWCGVHGTYHFSNFEELRMQEVRAQVRESYHGTHGGTRVIRRKVRE